MVSRSTSNYSLGAIICIFNSYLLLLRSNSKRDLLIETINTWTSCIHITNFSINSWQLFITQIFAQYFLYPFNNHLQFLMLLIIKRLFISSIVCFTIIISVLVARAHLVSIPFSWKLWFIDNSWKCWCLIFQHVVITN